MIKVCPNKLMQYANRECNAIMTIAKCTNTAASSNDSNHHSSTPAAWFASGTAYHGRRYQNLGSWTSWRSYTIVDSSAKDAADAILRILTRASAHIARVRAHCACPRTFRVRIRKTASLSPASKRPPCFRSSYI